MSCWTVGCTWATLMTGPKIQQQEFSAWIMCILVVLQHMFNFVIPFRIRRFPDFSYITTDEPLTEHLDCIIISHFHLDHCGALPYMTEMVGYNGPIYMTVPTKAIAPILLEDMRKVAVDKKGEQNFFTSAMIKDCMKKVVAVNLHQVVQVDSELEIKAYYAGHVLGAAMFQVPFLKHLF